MLKLAVLVSGGGTNLQAIIDAIADGRITNAKIEIVISNNPHAYALKRAEKAGISFRCICPRDYADREDFHEALLLALEQSGADLVVLAGCMVVIPEQIVRRYENRMINIHPSLIPSFCGKDYYGLRVHEEALARGVKERLWHILCSSLRNAIQRASFLFSLLQPKHLSHFPDMHEKLP